MRLVDMRTIGGGLAFLTYQFVPESYVPRVDVRSAQSRP
jgi:hypothetical protein